ncbi:MAG: RNA-directed DNA polymerase, partial [Planctomycetaceae bacterium]|nr:RNA-directed DNA polymerase [Planctomycetaceae bacterium]
KKTGGIRKISAPMPRLKRLQEWILSNILEKVPLQDAAHGFRRGRSIVTNAAPHVGQDVVLNMDLENFFPTIDFPRIRGVFRKLGYSGQISTVFALICSEPEIEEVQLDGQAYFVATTDRRLPQGAPTSPAITNIICRGLDARLTGVAQRFGFTYTRYADDITFSGSGGALQQIGKILRQCKYIIEQEDFKVHPQKSRVFRKSSRQEVTGLSVNERLGINRQLLRRFRALLFQIDRDGPSGKHWGHSTDVMTSIEGFANFIAMVNPDQGQIFQQRVRQLHEKHGRGQRMYNQRNRWNDQEVVTHLPDSSEKPELPAEMKKKPWWKFW